MLGHYKIFYPNSDGLNKFLQLIWHRPAAAGLSQQGHTELHTNTLSLCERWDGHLERALR